MSLGSRYQCRCLVSARVTRPFHQDHHHRHLGSLEATTSAYTIERIERIQAARQAYSQGVHNGRHYSSSSRHRPSLDLNTERNDKQSCSSSSNYSSKSSASSSTPSPRKKYPGRQPRVRPRLTPDALPLLGPISPDSLSWRNTHRLTTLRTLLSDENCDIHDLLNAYQRLHRSPGGTALLTPEDARQLVFRLSQSRRTPLSPRQAISHILSILDGAVDALNAYPTEYPPQAQEWQALLTDPQIQAALIELLSKSVKRSSSRELQDAFDMVSRSSNGQGKGQSKRSLLTYNVLLNLVAKSVPISTPRTVYYAGLGGMEDKEGLVSEHWEDLWSADEAGRQVRKSLVNATKLFQALWSAIYGDNLRPDSYSYSSKIAMESKRAIAEIIKDMEDAFDAERKSSISSNAHHLDGQERQVWPDLTQRGWQRITDTLRKASRDGQLTLLHVNQALSEYSRLRLSVKVKLEAHKGPMPDWSVHPTLKCLTSSEVSSQYVKEVYETLRWNEVQMEMLSLHNGRQSKGQKIGQEGKDQNRSSWFPAFWSRFGCNPGNADHSGVNTSVKTQNSESPKLSLLGISVPKSLRPDASTYTISMRYFGATEGDYTQCMDIFQDYLERDSTADNKCTLPVLDTLISAFAHHGIPAERYSEYDSDGVEKLGWALPDEVAIDSNASQWNVVNLLQLFERVMELRPRPSIQEDWLSRRSEMYQRISEGSIDDEEFLTSKLSSPALRSRSTTSGVEYAPTANQIWTWIIALRRVTGDRYNGFVLDWYSRWRSKFSSESNHQEEVKEEEPEPDVKSTSPLAGFFNSTLTSSVLAEREKYPHQYLHHTRNRYLDDKRYGGSVGKKKRRRGWSGWKTTARLERLIAFLQERKRIIG
ncbi:unnamed protein product [Sympodiomycopsis kandeliae]